MVLSEEAKDIMGTIQFLIEYLYSLGLDSNSIHNIVEVAKIDAREKNSIFNSSNVE